MSTVVKFGMQYTGLTQTTITILRMDVLSSTDRYGTMCPTAEIAAFSGAMKAVLALTLAAISTTVFADTQATFTLPSGVNVKIVEAPFDKTVFKVSGCTETGMVCLINGRIPFGVAFGLPKTYVQRISVSYRGQSYLLDVSNMYDAWGERPLEYKGIVRYFGGKCSDPKNCQFRGIFSDGAGSFVAEWRIVTGVPVRTVLSGSNDIVNLFKKDIDPPEFQ